MAELQGLQLKNTELGQHNAEVVAVVVDPVEQNAKVVEQLKLSYRIVADTEHADGFVPRVYAHENVACGSDHRVNFERSIRSQSRRQDRLP